MIKGKFYYSIADKLFGSKVATSNVVVVKDVLDKKQTKKALLGGADVPSSVTDMGSERSVAPESVGTYSLEDQGFETKEQKDNEQKDNEEDKAAEPSIQLPLGKHNDVPDSEFDAEQLALGIKTEMEHTDNVDIAKAIAKDHISELKNYYTLLLDMESKAGTEVSPIMSNDIPVGLKDIDTNPQPVPQPLQETASKKVADFFHEDDNLLRGITYGDLITAVESNEKVINETVVANTFNAILHDNIHDANFDLNQEMPKILKRLSTSQKESSKTAGKILTKEQLLNQYKGKYVDVYPLHYEKKDKDGNWVTVYELRGVSPKIKENYNLPEDAITANKKTATSAKLVPYGKYDIRYYEDESEGQEVEILLDGKAIDIKGTPENNFDGNSFDNVNEAKAWIDKNGKASKTAADEKPTTLHEVSIRPKEVSKEDAESAKPSPEDVTIAYEDFRIAQSKVAELTKQIKDIEAKAKAAMLEVETSGNLSGLKTNVNNMVDKLASIMEKENLAITAIGDKIVALRDFNTQEKVVTNQEKIAKIQAQIQKLTSDMVAISQAAEPIAKEINSRILDVFVVTKDKRSSVEVKADNGLLDVLSNLYMSIRDLFIDTKEVNALI